MFELERVAGVRRGWGGSWWPESSVYVVCGYYVLLCEPFGAGHMHDIGAHDDGDGGDDNSVHVFRFAHGGGGVLI